MNKMSLKSTVVVLLVCIGFSCNHNPKISDSDNNINDQRLDSLLSKMTLKEKVGQMTQINLTVIAKGPNKWGSTFPLEIDHERAMKALVDYKVGSVLNTINNTAQTPETWYGAISTIQHYAMDSNRLKVPIIYGIDAIHGTTYTDGATMFPQQITAAASWNPKNAYNMAMVSAYETRASSIPWNFSPVLDLGLDPRFPRQFESFGEDPLLVKTFGEAMIRGYQGDSNQVHNKTKIAACMKHFIGYHATISGKDRTPSYIPDHVLSEYHIPSFKAAIDAGAKTIMINSGIINGIPVHSSYKILTDLLRNRLGFEGVILTDWEDINKLHDRDKIVSSKKEAIRLAINAGIDMSMVPYEYEEFIDKLIELVNEGKVTMDRIDEAVSKILKLKFELDLFENPSTSPSDYNDFASEEFQGMAYQSAAESITLLKNNDNILPLERDKKILVVGPNADNMRCLNGAWTYSWQGELTDQFATNYQTIFEALKIEFGEDNVDMKEGVSYKEGGQYYDMIEKNIDDAVNASKESDVIVLCLGETSYTEKPGDINDITLHKLQLKLASQLASSGKPMVLVLNQGRPRLITAIEKYMSAIVNIYLPGNYGGVALADVLSGDVNPSGKLPFTYPAYTNSLSPYYYKPSEVQNNAQGAYNYVGEVNTLYDFGYGLSYSSFKYSDFTLSQDTITDRNGEISASFSVSNESNLDGFEVVQLYSSDKYASITPDIKRLRAFKRVFVPANSKVDVNLTFDVSDLSFYNIENASVLEQGEFQIHVGSSSSNVNTKSIFVE